MLKKISNIFVALFTLVIIFILIDAKLEWSDKLPFHFNVMPIVIIIFIITALSMLIVSILGIIESINKYGKRKFCKRFIKKWLLYFGSMYLLAFLKKDIDIPIILVASFAISILSYYKMLSKNN